MYYIRFRFYRFVLFEFPFLCVALELHDPFFFLVISRIFLRIGAIFCALLA